MAKYYLNKTGLSHLWSKIKTYFLPLSGGTISSTTGGPLKINRTNATSNTQVSCIDYLFDGERAGLIGFFKDGKCVIRNDNGNMVTIDKSGNGTFAGTVTATSFNGNATSATKLQATAWTAVPTTGAVAMSSNSLTYKKVGQIIFVRGSVKFSSAESGPTIGTLPSGCRPTQTMFMTGWSGDKVSAYGIVVDTNGVIALQSPSTSPGWFSTGTSFHVDISFVTT